MQYCAREDLTAWLDPSSFGNSVVQMALEASADLINNKTDDQFVREAAAEKRFNGEGKGLLMVSPSLWAVTKIELWDDSDGTLDYTLLPDEFEFDKPYVQLRSTTLRRPRFPVGQANVRITGDWGWPQVPATIRLASARLTCALLTGHSAENIQAEQIGNYNVSFQDQAAGGEQTTVNAILERYKLHRIIGGRIRGRRHTDFDDDRCPRHWSFIRED